jgi:hypothetical protein
VSKDHPPCGGKRGEATNGLADLLLGQPNLPESRPFLRLFLGFAGAGIPSNQKHAAVVASAGCPILIMFSSCSHLGTFRSS